MGATYVAFVAVLVAFASYRPAVLELGDNAQYLGISNALLRWRLGAIGQVKLFWGFPYAVAAVSKLTHAPLTAALIGVSVVASLSAVTMAARLWGGTVAAYFAIINWDWIRRSLLGGSEPLFVALLFGSFLAARRERWLISALLASLACTVRPVGIFALAGIAVALVRKRHFVTLFGGCAIAAGVAAAYIVPMARSFGDPAANWSGYRTADWAGPSPVTFPIYAVIRAMDWQHPAREVYKVAWIVFALTGMWLARLWLKQAVAGLPVEGVFAVLYLLFLVSYNSPEWAVRGFPRFAIPIVPFILLGYRRWLPKRPWTIGCIGPAMAATAAIAAVYGPSGLRAAQ